MKHPVIEPSPPIITTMNTSTSQFAAHPRPSPARDRGPTSRLQWSASAEPAMKTPTNSRVTR